jgi:hypothetical protein
MRRLAFISVLAVAVALPLAGIARSEIKGDGGLFVAFDGSFSPRVLPRDRDVPVTVRLSGSVKTADGTRPPQLRTISIAVNRYGRLSTRGLPACLPGLLESTDSQTALARCGSAVVGRGGFGANVEFPDRSPFPVEGRVLAFNGRSHGHAAILVHIHGSKPVEATVVLVFRIRHPARGKFGTVLTTRIPRIASDLGYVTDIALVFGRTYRVGGERRSFISARCAAPAGFPGALFTFAKAAFTFAGGKRITPALVRDCVVR